MTATEPTRRQLLVALATAPIHRAALCRLGEIPHQWADLHGACAAREAARRLGLPYAQLRRALDLRPRAVDIASAEATRAQRAGARIITRLDPDYPRALLDLGLAPPTLYLRGSLREWPAPAVAMVGARKLDDYGRRVAERFAEALASTGVSVISGFAVGVDQACHRGALAAAGGHTVAVLGCGIDIDYPARSRRLAARIAADGALLSELPMGTRPRPFHFPMRNRMIAALGLGVLVVQAKARSGSLITAHHALELGRDVWAVPGPIDAELADGPNGLIADGALLIRTPEELLDALPLAAQQVLFPTTRTTLAGAPAATLPAHAVACSEPPITGLAGTVLRALPAGEARSADALASATEMPVEQVLGALLELELGGRVRRIAGPRFERQ